MADEIIEKIARLTSQLETYDPEADATARAIERLCRALIAESERRGAARIIELGIGEAARAILASSPRPSDAGRPAPGACVWCFEPHGAQHRPDCRTIIDGGVAPGTPVDGYVAPAEGTAATRPKGNDDGERTDGTHDDRRDHGGTTAAVDAAGKDQPVAPSAAKAPEPLPDVLPAGTRFKYLHTQKGRLRAVSNVRLVRSNEGLCGCRDEYVGLFEHPDGSRSFDQACVAASSVDWSSVTPPAPKPDPRPLCVRCRSPWVPAEGVDATVTACPACEAKPDPAGEGASDADNWEAKNQRRAVEIYELAQKNRVSSIMIRDSLNCANSEGYTRGRSDEAKAREGLVERCSELVAFVRRNYMHIETIASRIKDLESELAKAGVRGTK